MKHRRREKEAGQSRTATPRRSRFVDEADACQRIEREHGKAGMVSKIIQMERPGLKVLSAIDYLVSRHGYIWAGQEERLEAVVAW